MKFEYRGGQSLIMITLLSHFRMNVDNKKLEVSLRAPVYEIDGYYSCSGGVYELPISSNGRFSVTMS